MQTEKVEISLDGLTWSGPVYLRPAVDRPPGDSASLAPGHVWAKGPNGRWGVFVDESNLAD